MTSEEMKKRTKRFAIAIVRFAQTLPKDSITAVMTRQADEERDVSGGELPFVLSREIRRGFHLEDDDR